MTIKMMCVMVRAADRWSVGLPADDRGQGIGAWLQAEGLPTWLSLCLARSSRWAAYWVYQPTEILGIRDYCWTLCNSHGTFPCFLWLTRQYNTIKTFVSFTVVDYWIASECNRLLIKSPISQSLCNQMKVQIVLLCSFPFQFFTARC